MDDDSRGAIPGFSISKVVKELEIKKVEEKPMVIHQKGRIHIHRRKGKDIQKRAEKSKVTAGLFAKKNDSIKIRDRKLKTMAYAGARMAAKEVEGGEELQESVDVITTVAMPAVDVARKGERLYRKKQAKRKEDKRKKESKSSSEREHTVKTSKAKKVEKEPKSQQTDTSKKKGKKGSSHSFVKSRMIESFVNKLRTDNEEQGNLITGTTKVAKDIAMLAMQSVLIALAPYLVLIALVMSLAGVIVVAILAVIYNSPLGIFFPMPDTGYESPRTVLSEYYKEFNQEIVKLEDQGYLITYQNTKDGVPVSNYNDTLMVYMVKYGTGQCGLVMDEQGKKNLKEVFDAMNYYDSSSSTMQVPAGASLGDVVATGYCACSICCGQWAGGNTASGTTPKAKHTLAVDAYNPIVPMGTKVIIAGTTYTVEDTGNLNAHGTDFDIFFASHQEALNWGKQTVEAFLAEGNENMVEVTTSGTVVHNLTYADYIALGDFTEDQTALLTKMMSDESWDSYYECAGGQAVADLARTKLGCHYSQERRMEEGYYDCSSLVYRLYKEIGIELPTIASDQGKYCYENAMLVNKEELRPGDLIFYSYEVNNQFRNISHVAIYVGDGKMIHAANTERGVVEDNLSTSGVVFYARPYKK